MKLLLIAHVSYEIYAACSDRGDCELLNFLNELEGDRQDQADRLMNLLENVSINGPPRRPEVCHLIQDDIWQLESGKLRVLWFYGRGRGIIVCTHGFSKSTQKTPKRQIKKAKGIHRRYFDDADQGNIEIIKLQDEE